MREMARGHRNNNPGNIRHSDDAWRGMTSDQSGDAEFVQFETAEYGIRAMVRLLDTYQERYGLNTVGDIIRRWAPANENHTDNYIQIVRRFGRFEPGQRIDVDRYDECDRLVQAMIRVELGYQPYDRATLDRGYALAGVRKGRAGQRRKAQQGGVAAAAATAVAAAAEPIRDGVDAAWPALGFAERLGWIAPWLGVAVGIIALGVLGYVVWQALDDDDGTVSP